jgi:hypothetical protein
MTMLEEESERENIEAIVETLTERFEQFVPIRSRPDLDEVLPDRVVLDDRVVSTIDVKEDLSHFIQQTEFDQPNYVVEMEDDGLDQHDPSRRKFDVLVKVPDLKQRTQTYDNFLQTLAASGFQISMVDRPTARKTFFRGLAEFLFARSRSGLLGTPPVTEVHTKRKGDTVLYAKGYFLSTGTAFGTSWPAFVALPSGRYSFGIEDWSGQRFEKTVRSIPSIGVVMVKLP